MFGRVLGLNSFIRKCLDRLSFIRRTNRGSLKNSELLMSLMTLHSWGLLIEPPDLLLAVLVDLLKSRKPLFRRLVVELSHVPLAELFNLQYGLSLCLGSARSALRASFSAFLRSAVASLCLRADRRLALSLNFFRR